MKDGELTFFQELVVGLVAFALCAINPILAVAVFIIGSIFVYR
jgi:hypothetical protein